MTGFSLDEDFFEEETPQLKKLQSEMSKVDGILSRNIDFIMKHNIKGFKSVSYLNSDVFFHAPKDYFDRFQEPLLKLVQRIKGESADRDISDLLATAAANPEDYDKLNEAYDAIEGFSDGFLNDYNFSGVARKVLFALAMNEVVGLGMIDPLYRDPRITEININAPDDVQVEVNGRFIRVYSCKFRDVEHLESWIERILLPLGKRSSRVTPAPMAHLHDLSRAQITDTIITPKSPTVSLRRHKDHYIPPATLVDWGSTTPEVMTTIGNLFYNGASGLVIGATGSGKALHKDTLIPTLDGMKPMGEVQVGDVLFDENGVRTSVLKKYCPEDPDMYEVSFSNGESVAASAGHLWQVELQNKPRTQRGSMARPLLSRSQLKLLYKATNSPINDDELVSYPQLQEMLQLRGNHVKKLIRKALKPAMSNTYGVFYNKAELLQFLKQENLRTQLEATKCVEAYRKATTPVLTTQQLVEQGILDENGRSRFAIRPMTSSVDYEEQDLLVDPYVLGVWLMDGDKDSGLITGVDSEIWHEISTAYPGQKALTEEGFVLPNYRWEFKGLEDDLRELGMFEKRQIPPAYKIGATWQREELLCGVVDAAGEIGRDGKIKVRVPSLAIAYDLKEIAASLGFMTKELQIVAGDNLVDPSGKTVFLPLTCVLEFTPSVLLTLRLSRKYQKLNKVMAKTLGQPNSERFYITEIKKLSGNKEDFFCLAVDSPSHLFVCSPSFIPTHNTTAMNSFTGFFRPDQRIVTMEDNLEMMPCPTKLIGPQMQCVDPDFDGKHGVTMRDLVKVSLRQHPHIIIVGEVRGSEAYDMLQALSTGHYGTSTVHADNAHDALTRLTGMISQSGVVGGASAALTLIGSGLDFIVETKLFRADGSRKITGVFEVGHKPVKNEEGELTLEMTPLWEFVGEGVVDGRVRGHWEKRGELSEYTYKKLHLELAKHLSWEELKELSKG